jgi:hypothetical protein
LPQISNHARESRPENDNANGTVRYAQSQAVNKWPFYWPDYGLNVTIATGFNLNTSIHLGFIADPLSGTHGSLLRCHIAGAREELFAQ